MASKSYWKLIECDFKKYWDLFSECGGWYLRIPKIANSKKYLESGWLRKIHADVNRLQGLNIVLYSGDHSSERQSCN